MSKPIRIQKPAIDYNPPVYNCKKATKPFVLDGNIDKAFWQEAEFTEEFIDIEGEHMPKPRFSTKAKMLWDDQNFYFGAVLEGDEIWANLTERDCVIFHDNDFEIFIDPDSDTHQYYEFEMNALNTIWDLFLTKPYRDMGKALNSWDIKGIQSAVHIDGELNNPNGDNRRWMVEVVMPFESLLECAEEASKPKVGDYWKVNFSRVQWLVDIEEGQYVKRKKEGSDQFCPEDNWVWAPTGVINIHYPEMWGLVFFVESDEKMTIPEDEKDKYQLRWLYYQQHEHFDLHGSFTRDIEYLSKGIELSITPKIEVTENNFEMSFINQLGDIQYRIHSDGRVYKQKLMR